MGSKGCFSPSDLYHIYYRRPLGWRPKSFRVLAIALRPIVRQCSMFFCYMYVRVLGVFFFVEFVRLCSAFLQIFDKGCVFQFLVFRFKFILCVLTATFMLLVVYAFGMLLFELITLQRPFAERRAFDIPELAQKYAFASLYIFLMYQKSVLCESVCAFAC